MKKIKSLLAIPFLFFLAINGNCQQNQSVRFKADAQGFTLPVSKVIDSNTNAVIISDIGSVDFVGSKSNNWVSYVYKRKKRIKIINNKAMNLATVVLTLFEYNDRKEQIDSITGTTYNLEGGEWTSTTLNPADIYETSPRSQVIEKKFTLPAVKEGSIIEYSYQITSPFDYRMRTWHFQSEYAPCLYSDFQFTVPQILSYIQARHGLDSLQVNTTDKLKDQYYMMASVNVKMNATRHHWTMKDIPAFKKEPFVSAPDEYMDKIEFYLAQRYNGENLSTYSNTWPAKIEELLKDDNFGLALHEDNIDFLTQERNKSLFNDSDPRRRARKIYTFVRDNIEAEEDDNIFVNTALYDVFKRQKGTQAEVNMLLVAMLRANGIKADPVILGTKEYGTAPDQYPIMSKINDVICVAYLGNDSVYLDASRKSLGFGQLPLECYNGAAHIISQQSNHHVFFYPDDIKEQKMTTVFIAIGADGKWVGSYEATPGLFGSQIIREDIRKKGMKKYFETIKLSQGFELEPASIGVDSLNQPDFPVRVHWDFNVPVDKNVAVIYYNPVIKTTDEKNLFPSGERKFPVELDYPLNEMYVLNMDIPKGYIVDEMPKSAKVALNENDGMFEYLIAKDESSIQLQIKIRLRRATFLPEEYPALHNFFDYIVKKEKEQIVFKKVSQ